MIDPTTLKHAESRKVGQTNNSLYVTIPTAVAAALGIGKGDVVTIGETDGQAVLLPKGEGHATAQAVARVEQLIAENRDALDYLADR